MKRTRRARAVFLAIAALLLPALGPAAARRQPTTATAPGPPADDAAALARARELYTAMNRGTGNYYDSFRQIVRLGEPVQVFVLEVLAKGEFADDKKVQILTEEWRRMGLRVSERHRAEAVKLLPRVAEANRSEALQVLELFPRWPELAPAYAAMITNYSERVRDPAVDRLMELDPSGRVAVEAVKEAMKTPSGGHDYRYYEPLRRIGEPAIPLLLQLTYEPDLDTRSSALKAMKPLDGRTFREAVAERAVDLYLDPVSDLGYTEYDAKQFASDLRRDVLNVLDSMGERGRATADDLRAGKRPANAARRRMMEQLDAPEFLKAALFPEDPARSVPGPHWEVIQELARLHKQDPRKAVERAFELLAGSGGNPGVRVIAARLLRASPEVGRRPDDLRRLIEAASRPADPPTHGAAAAALLDGRFEYGPEIRGLCMGWLSSSSYNDQNQAINLLKTLPLGRRAMIEALAPTEGAGRGGIPPSGMHSSGGRILDALIERHPPLAGLKTAHEIKQWTEAPFRAAVGRVVAAADADPAGAERLLVERLADPDPNVAAVAATALSDVASRARLGPVTRGRVLRLTPVQIDTYGMPPLIAPERPGAAYPAPPPQPPTPAPEATGGLRALSPWAWWVTAALAGSVALGATLLLLFSPAAGRPVHPR